MQMFRRLTGLACVLFIAAAQPAAPSPQADADFIAAKLIKSDEYRKLLSDRITNARVNGATQALSEHSVKIMDFERLAELLSDYEIPAEVFDRHQRFVADRLIEKMQPGQLASLAQHVRNLDAQRTAARTDETERVMTLDEFRDSLEEIEGLADDPVFKHEMELMSVGIMLIGLAVRASTSGEVGPTSSELADLLEVDGVFGFPNRIVRRDVIRELRAADP